MVSLTESAVRFYGGRFLRAAGSLLAAVLLCTVSLDAQAATALILDPPPGFKLAEGQRRKVEVRIASGDPAAEWRLAVAPTSVAEPGFSRFPPC